MEPIHSADNPAIRALGRLLDTSKERHARGLTVLEGPHLVAEGLRVGRVTELWATPEALQSREAPALLTQAGRSGIKARQLSASLLKRLNQLPAPQGWLAVAKTEQTPVPSAPSLSLALDGVQDPGNMGTLLRAAWAAQAAVILGPGCADPWSPKVLRSGSGAQFGVLFESVENLALRLQTMKRDGVQVLAAAPRAETTHWDSDLKGPSCLVLGAEGPGLSETVSQVCDQTIRIPYPGGAESLNVAMAGGLLLFEALRQRR